MHVTNHLLFVDDLKLLAADEDIMKAMAEEVELLEGTQGYKYLGIMENRTSAPTRENYDKVRAEILERIERLAK
ncbi:unnamed protein product [Thelazia callipaeda]|uniref:Reverse transcriptase domain-containing protein n=1 Tax=Thelazia callipaeda TaxID=103827 RepID=A0A0N5D4F6_THECL|nr:unnamed protein product [Thelazia callipaeda]